ncbi:MAG: hypothetical protein ABFS34_01640 [Gemmatimonadota bacterium]
MSGKEADASGAESGWDRLEASVEELLTRNEALAERARAAEERVAELQSALKTAKTGVADARGVASELKNLRKRNGLLEDRMADGRARVRRISERLRLAQEG